MSKEIQNLFKNTVALKKGARIKLLGDSITHGVGGTGFEQNGEHIIDEFSRNPDGYCWANLLRDYMKQKFDATVINNACLGTKIEFIVDNFEKLVCDDDDLIICTIGTNNRHKYFVDGPKPTKKEHIEEFYNNIIKLNDIFKKAGKEVIFVANIPAGAANELDGVDYWRIIHMSDIRDCYVKAQKVCDFPLINLYDIFSEYCEKSGLCIDSLLDDSLHPNNAGYKIIFELICNELGV